MFLIVKKCTHFQKIKNTLKYVSIFKNHSFRIYYQKKKQIVNTHENKIMTVNESSCLKTLRHLRIKESSVWPFDCIIPRLFALLLTVWSWII